MAIPLINTIKYLLEVLLYDVAYHISNTRILGPFAMSSTKTRYYKDVYIFSLNMLLPFAIPFSYPAPKYTTTNILWRLGLDLNQESMVIKSFRFNNYILYYSQQTIQDKNVEAIH
jgi:hypothetical protein